MAYIELKAPKTIKDFRIRHMKAFTNPDWTTVAGNTSPLDVVNFVAEFFGHVPEFIQTLDWDDVKKVYSHLIGEFNKIELKAPPKHITVNGKNYDLVNFDRPTTGWIVDATTADFKKEPVRLAAICYVPAGTTYGEVDKHRSVIHPSSDRMEEFAAHFPLDTYCQVSAFFLQRWERSVTKKMKILNLRSRWVRRGLRLSNGLRSLMRLPKITGFNGMRSHK